LEQATDGRIGEGDLLVVDGLDGLEGERIENGVVPERGLRDPKVFVTQPIRRVGRKPTSGWRM
jgi:hypothetical protein